MQVWCLVYCALQHIVFRQRLLASSSLRTCHRRCQLSNDEQVWLVPSWDLTVFERAVTVASHTYTTKARGDVRKWPKTTKLAQVGQKYALEKPLVAEHGIAEVLHDVVLVKHAPIRRQEGLITKELVPCARSMIRHSGHRRNTARRTYRGPRASHGHHPCCQRVGRRNHTQHGNG